MTISIIPAPHTVVQIPRTLSALPDPDTGNHEFIEGTPVVRKVQSLTQYYGNHGSSNEVMGADVTERINTEMQMVVADPDTYNPSDLIVIDPKLDDAGAWVPDTGEMYFVDGKPHDERKGPWPQLLSMFGGSVKLRRIT